MLIDRERSFNPLQADRVRQFDAEHGDKVRHETGWYIFADGSNRDAHGDVLEDASVMKPADRRKWQTYWHRQMIQSLAERFRREREKALQTLNEEDEAKVQALHDRLVELKKNLDKIEQEATAPPVREVTHGIRGGEAWHPYADGQEHLRKLRTARAKCDQELEHAVRLLKAAKGDAVATARRDHAIAERRAEESLDALIAHRRWLRLPFAKRKEINEALLAEKSERDRREYEPYRQRKERLAKLSLGFVEDDADMQSPSQRREAEDRQRDDAVREEGAAFLSPRMAAKEERLERARKQDVEQASRNEFAEAAAEAEELAPKPAKRRGRPPKAKR